MADVDGVRLTFGVADGEAEGALGAITDRLRVMYNHCAQKPALVCWPRNIIFWPGRSVMSLVALLITLLLFRMIDVKGLVANGWEIVIVVPLTLAIVPIKA